MHTKDERGKYHLYDGKPAKTYWGISEWYKHGEFTGKETFPPSRDRADTRSGGSTVDVIRKEVDPR